MERTYVRTWTKEERKRDRVNARRAEVKGPEKRRDKKKGKKTEERYSLVVKSPFAP